MAFKGSYNEGNNTTKSRTGDQITIDGGGVFTKARYQRGPQNLQTPRAHTKPHIPTFSPDAVWNLDLDQTSLRLRLGIRSTLPMRASKSPKTAAWQLIQTQRSAAGLESEPFTEKTWRCSGLQVQANQIVAMGATGTSNMGLDVHMVPAKCSKSAIFERGLA